MSNCITVFPDSVDFEFDLNSPRDIEEEVTGFGMLEIGAAKKEKFKTMKHLKGIIEKSPWSPCSVKSFTQKTKNSDTLKHSIEESLSLIVFASRGKLKHKQAKERLREFNLCGLIGRSPHRGEEELKFTILIPTDKSKVEEDIFELISPLFPECELIDRPCWRIFSSPDKTVVIKGKRLSIEVAAEIYEKLNDDVTDEEEFHEHEEEKDDNNELRESLSERISRKRKKVSSVGTVPFMSDAFRGVLEHRTGVILGAAVSKNGKSSSAANVTAHFLLNSEKKVWHISNEETELEICSKLVGIFLGYGPNEFKDGNLHGVEEKRAQKLIENFQKRLSIYDKENGLYATNHLNSVMELFDDAELREDVGLVVLDSFDKVKLYERDRYEKQLNNWEVSKKMEDALVKYGKEYHYPIYVTTQLKKNSDDIKNRTEGTNSLVNSMDLTIEIKKNSKKKQTTFLFHYDRRGELDDKKVIAHYIGSKYVPIAKYG